ncbi:MAG: 16S rRNA (adenine(1518)-N(6)/adenine(1519)-N(6))-dimethyltransferase RsmA [Flavobacteriales bacterium]|nr:16S rRNA (adenine(1518)-N(6)/adenine(1519)-N(6))-dimethyltransferase RsmA [Flavobacteriales bacterium]MCB9190800.1 16S rRNA (adenine(1518)-N(6)/adenine(1519)-N(6))-dimethyltransferase RsmA [Flavobacteriales bacterium]
MVRPKKHLGQHFLKDQNIAAKIADALTGHGNYKHLLEVGPGTGVLTQFLLQKEYEVHAVEMDSESVVYLKENFIQLTDNLIEGDFLKLVFNEITEGPLCVIGNFPYNISSQIFFKVLDNRNKVPECIGMIQKEVADRIAAGPGSKTYGILSVLLQAYYDIDYLFKVPPGVFHPPPKVDSAVIRLRRNNVKQLDCDEKKFIQVVKAAFNQRRKTLRNALKTFTFATAPDEHLLTLRAERLSVEDFVHITKCVAD